MRYAIKVDVSWDRVHEGLGFYSGAKSNDKRLLNMNFPSSNYNLLSRPSFLKLRRNVTARILLVHIE